jgi:hypothetical protein
MHIQMSCPYCGRAFMVNVDPTRASDLIMTRVLICLACWDRARKG